MGFVSGLRELRSEEIARGVTTIGPHRDELRFLANDIDLGNYGSRGQVRTTLLSLKLAEVNWMKDRTGEWPVILLDEVMAELDLQRRADLLKYVGESEQVLFTTTDLNLFTPSLPRRRKCGEWKVEEWRSKISTLSGAACLSLAVPAGYMRRAEAWFQVILYFLHHTASTAFATCERSAQRGKKL